MVWEGCGVDGMMEAQIGSGQGDVDAREQVYEPARDYEYEFGV